MVMFSGWGGGGRTGCERLILCYMPLPILEFPFRVCVQPTCCSCDSAVSIDVSALFGLVDYGEVSPLGQLFN